MVSVADLLILKKAIEVACNRGAYQANEMSTIGPVYDKLSEWLDTVTNEEQDQADSTGEKDA
jgi:hypothetical protein